MIKIELSVEQKKEIEREFLADVCSGVEFGGIKKNRNQKGFDDILNSEECRNLLHDDYGKLYNYFYAKDGRLNTKQIKELLLADRSKMEELIKLLGTYEDKWGANPDAKQLLSTVFRYDNFSTRKAAYTILDKMGVTVCPYCNRAYIATLKEGKVRPQFDHYFPKAKYPYLALSLYNLIPSCGICNRTKADLDTREFPILYPYEEEFGEHIVFAVKIDNNDFVKCIRGNSDSIVIGIRNPEENALYEQVKNQDIRLHLTDLYNTHKDYVQDIFKSYYINTDRRVEELVRHFPDLFPTKEDVRSLLFMNYLRKDEWGKRPLAKLTYDIYREIGNVKS